MEIAWMAFVAARDETKAQKVLARLADRLGRAVAADGRRGLYRLAFSTPLGGERPPDLVYEARRAASSLSRAWRVDPLDDAFKSWGGVAQGGFSVRGVKWLLFSVEEATR